MENKKDFYQPAKEMTLGLEGLVQVDSWEQQFLTPNNEAFYEAGLYGPLQVSAEQIRLCKFVYEGNDHNTGGPIRLEIVQPISLHDKPQYDAVSYCAGDPMDTRAVLVNGYPFNVFATVYGLLELLYRQCSTQYLWIDQLCMDQTNYTERSEQVTLMRQIYASSENTLLWMGHADDDEASRLDNLVREVHAKIAREDGVNDLTDYHPTLYFGQSREADFQALIRFCQTRWWTRCWTLQEAIVAPSPVFLWGTAYLAFEKVRHTICLTSIAFYVGYSKSDAAPILLADLTSPLMSIFGNTVPQISLLFYERNTWHENGYVSARSAISIARSRQTTDSRDFLYSIIGLLHPDYTIYPRYEPAYTIVDVTMHFVRSMIERDQNLEILADSWEDNRDRTKVDLPSWVLDFDVPQGNSTPLRRRLESREKTSFDASLWSVAEDRHSRWQDLCKPTFEFTPDHYGRSGRILKCWMLDLGPVAHPNALGNIAQFPEPEPQPSETYADRASYGDRMMAYYRAVGQDWRAIMIASGLGPTYQWPLPDGKTEPIESAFRTCLAHGGPVNLDDKAEIDVATWANMHRTSRFFVSPTQIMGTVPSWARHDDTLAVLVGSRIPYVLRPKREKGFDPEYDFDLIGGCYLHSYMEGRAVREILQEERPMEKIRRVRIH